MNYKSDRNAPSRGICGALCLIGGDLYGTSPIVAAIGKNAARHLDTPNNCVAQPLFNRHHHPLAFVLISEVLRDLLCICQCSDRAFSALFWHLWLRIAN